MGFAQAPVTDSFEIRSAKREQSPERIAIIGPSGFGKTLSALLMAYGFGEKFCVIDTEGGKAERFQGIDIGEFTNLPEYKGKKLEYDVLRMNPPFSPDRYVKAIEYIEQAGHKICIIDNASYEWAGPGGCLEIVDSLMPSTTNKMAVWKRVTPLHQKFLNKIVTTPMHIIATLRTKVEWSLDKDSNGSSAPKKLGIGPVQRDQFEYEFTIMLRLNEAHQATIDIEHDPTLADIGLAPFYITPKTTAWLFQRRKVAEKKAPAVQPTPAAAPPAK